MAARLGVFVDISNLYYCVDQHFSSRVNYAKYLANAIKISNGILMRAYAYGSQISNEASAFLDCLKSFGYEPKYKEPKQYSNPEYAVDLNPLERIVNQITTGDKTEEGIELLKNAIATIDGLKTLLKKKQIVRKADWDVGLTMDIVRLVDRLDVVVIGSADSDFAPIVEWVRDRGCKCIVYACNISNKLRNAADICIEIDETVLEPKVTSYGHQQPAIT